MNDVKYSYDLEMRVIDIPTFEQEFSRAEIPRYPQELMFWVTASDEDKHELMKRRPDMWKQGLGKEYVDKLSRSQCINSRNIHFLTIFEKEEMSEERRHKVMRCLGTYKNLEIK